MNRSTPDVNDFRAIRNAYIMEFQRLMEKYRRAVRHIQKPWTAKQCTSVAAILHRLKGASSFAGYYHIAWFAYALGGMLQQLPRDEAAEADRRSICAAAVAVLHSFLVDVISGRAEPGTDASELLDRIADWKENGTVSSRTQEETAV
jgi:chemotaxis protein histidine kinase CheA